MTIRWEPSARAGVHVRAWRFGVCLVVVLCGLALSAVASASPLISEIHTDPGAGNAAFIEIQLSQDEASFPVTKIFSGEFSTPDAECSIAAPANLGSQRTYLVGDSDVSGRDANLCSTPLENPLSTGGWACLSAGSASAPQIDCVAWGSYSGCGSFCDGVGSPAASGGIPSGQSIARRIDRGCATQLDPADDTNDSATDFAVAAPSPRSNQTTPTETACTPVVPPPVVPPPTGTAPTGETPPSQDTPPTTAVSSAKVKSSARKATFVFGGSDDHAGALGFQCKLDRNPFQPCASPKTYRHLSVGRHTVSIRCVDAAGNADPTPAVSHFKVHGKAKKHG